MLSQSYQPLPSDNAGVTEVVLPRDNQMQFAMILPMLAYLSRQAQDRWLTWIAPKGISRHVLEAYDFDLSKVRLVHTKNEEETLWVLWEALSKGNSEAVVASPGKLSEKALSKLETAAYSGNCQGLLIRFR
jgi:cell division inhibitor SulA